MEDRMFRVQLFGHHCSPGLSFFVRSNNNWLLRVEILLSILSQQGHCRKIVCGNMENLGNILQTVKMSINCHEGRHPDNLEELGDRKAAYCLTRLKSGILSGVCSIWYDPRDRTRSQVS